MIGTMAVGAAIGVSKVIASCGGKVYVYGTPAEETKGGKVTMAEQGVFDHLDAAMMVHPYCRHEKSGTSLAMDAIQFEFFGKASHAAGAPHEGINALDAVIQTFNGINALDSTFSLMPGFTGLFRREGKRRMLCRITRLPSFTSEEQNALMSMNCSIK